MSANTLEQNVLRQRMPYLAIQRIDVVYASRWVHRCIDHPKRSSDPSSGQQHIMRHHNFKHLFEKLICITTVFMHLDSTSARNKYGPSVRMHIAALWKRWCEHSVQAPLNHQNGTPTKIMIIEFAKKPVHRSFVKSNHCPENLNAWPSGSRNSTVLSS